MSRYLEDFLKPLLLNDPKFSGISMWHRKFYDYFEQSLRKEFDEKLNEKNLEFQRDIQSSMKSFSFELNDVHKILAQQQEKMEKLNTTLEQVQHENKSLRDELQSLRATLLEVLDALTANASGSPKDGPCANSSSEQ